MWVENPSCSQLLEQIESGTGLAYAKRTHGIWDHLALLLTNGWQADDWRRCDMMIFKELRPHDAAGQIARDDYMHYLTDILGDVVEPPKDDRWWSTVSLDLEYLTKKLRRPGFHLRLGSDPRLRAYWDWDYTYADVLGPHTNPSHPWLYAQTLTRGISDLSILELPQVARKFHVVVVAPKKARDLPTRWALDAGHFTMIDAPTWPTARPSGSLISDQVLPALRTFRLRQQLLRQLATVACSRPLLYLFEMGTCAQWLMRRLFDQAPHHVYLDMGRALEVWYPDHEWPLKRPTASIYRRAARAYYGDAAYCTLVAP